MGAEEPLCWFWVPRYWSKCGKIWKDMKSMSVMDGDRYVVCFFWLGPGLRIFSCVVSAERSVCRIRGSVGEMEALWQVHLKEIRWIFITKRIHGSPVLVLGKPMGLRFEDEHENEEGEDERMMRMRIWWSWSWWIPILRGDPTINHQRIAET